MQLQQRLAWLGYTDVSGHNVTQDGEWGPLTQSALEKFQQQARRKGYKNVKDNGGLPDPDTLEVFFNYSVPAPSLKISGENIVDPTFGASALKANTSIPVTGTIQSTHALKSVGAYIFYDNNGTKGSKVLPTGGGTVEPSKKGSVYSYSLNLMQQAKMLSFSLPGGSYIYEIDATDCDGQNISIVQYFTVEGGTTPPPQDPGQNTDDTVGSNTDYLGNQILSQAQLDLVNANKQFYINSGNKYGVPWQMIAVIHLREHNLYRSGPSNGQGPYQDASKNPPASLKSGSGWLIGVYNDVQFQTATDWAAQFIINKSAGKDLTVQDNIKYTFFAYNGLAKVYKTQAENLGYSAAQANNGEGSPYVMNRADAKRDPTVEPTKSNKTWGQIKRDYGPIEYPANTDYGAYRVFLAMGGGGSNKSPQNTSTAELIVKVANGMQPWGIHYLWAGGHGSFDDLKIRISKKFQGDYGVDCSGFVRTVVYEATGYDPGALQAGGGAGTGDGKLNNAKSGYFTRVDIKQAQSGDIFVINGGTQAHTGIVTSIYTSNVHIYSGTGSSGVNTIDVNNKKVYRSNVNIYRYIGPASTPPWNTQN